MTGDALGPVDPEHFRARVLQDVLAEATAGQWERRAAAFDAACSRPGDYTGQSTPEQRAERDARCAAVAQACRARAAVIRGWSP